MIQEELSQIWKVAGARLKADAVYSLASMGACPFIVGVAGVAVFYCRPGAFVAQAVLLVLPNAATAGDAGRR